MALPAERRRKIVAFIRQKRGATCSELCDRFEVSPGTVRSDLEALENMGLLKRTYGGAVISEDSIQGGTVQFKEREVINASVKDRIGAAAAALIKSGDSIFIDGSTTSLFVAKHLKHLDRITVITNAERIVMELCDEDNAKVICTGGLLRKNNLSYVGETAEMLIKSQYYADKMFFSCHGISRQFGLFDATESEATIKRAMFRSAKKAILLCDSSKFERIGFPKLADYDIVHTVVTETDPGPEWRALFDRYSIQLIVADP